MNQVDPIIAHELPVIQKIIRDEMWYEGERRGCYVPPDDPVVREHVCEIILRIGRELRETLMTRLAETSGSALLPASSPWHDKAA